MSSQALEIGALHHKTSLKQHISFRLGRKDTGLIMDTDDGHRCGHYTVLEDRVKVNFCSSPLSISCLINIFYRSRSGC